jgi:hypothetical protein
MMCMRSNEGKLERTERKINDKKVGWHLHKCMENDKERKTQYKRRNRKEIAG